MLKGSCHCGAVTLEIAELPSHLTECNCSLCRRLGARWGYAHPSRVKLDGPTDSYVQGDRTLELHRCKTCGIHTYWVSVDKVNADRMGYNARLFEPTRFANVPVRHLDGADTWQYLD